MPGLTDASGLNRPLDDTAAPRRGISREDYRTLRQWSDDLRKLAEEKERIALALRKQADTIDQLAQSLNQPK
jgi:hypothetical protein